MSRISFVPTPEWSEELRTFVAADSATELEFFVFRVIRRICLPKAQFFPH